MAVAGSPLGLVAVCGLLGSLLLTTGRDGQGLPVQRDGRSLAVVLENSGYVDGETLQNEWDETFVYLALLVGWFGAYVGFASSTARHTLQVESRFWYLVMILMAGFSWGVCTIWSVYFVGMQALVLHNGAKSKGSGRIPMTFQPASVVVSAFVVWLISAGAVHLLIRSRQSETSRNVKRSTALQVAASTLSIAGGICAMHGIGFMSQTGPFTMHINVGIMFAVVIGAIIVGGGGIFLVAWRPNNTAMRIIGAVLVSGSVNGLIFVSLEACVYTVRLDDGALMTDDRYWDIPSRDLAVAAFIVDLLLLGISNYHTERMQQFVTGKAEELEKLLRHQGYIKSASRLIRIAKSIRYPLSLITLEVFQKYGKIVKHEHLRDKGKIIFVDSQRHARRLRQHGIIIFISHQWLAHDHPDPSGSQFQEMVLAAKHFMRAGKFKPEQVFLWVDYSSVPQEALHLQQLAIESLPMYVTCANFFVIIAPQVMHANRNTPCNFTTYSDRLWCRLEVLCMILATMKLWRSKDPVETLLEEPSEVEQADSDMPRIIRALGKDLNSANKQVFIWMQDDLHPLTFWSGEGKIQACYENLLYLYEGDCTCCIQGHPKRDGEDIVCDKNRLVDVLTGVYGLMLVEMHKSQQSKSVGSNDYAASRAFAGEIVRQRQRIFPEQYFETRMEAMHQQVDQWKKTINDIQIEGDANECDVKQEEAEEALCDGSSQNSGSDSESGLTGSSGGSVAKKADDGVSQQESDAGSQAGFAPVQHMPVGVTLTVEEGPEKPPAQAQAAVPEMFDRGISDMSYSSLAGSSMGGPFISVMPSAHGDIRKLRPASKHTL